MLHCVLTLYINIANICTDQIIVGWTTILWILISIISTIAGFPSFVHVLLIRWTWTGWVIFLLKIYLMILNLNEVDDVGWWLLNWNWDQDAAVSGFESNSRGSDHQQEWVAWPGWSLWWWLWWRWWWLFWWWWLCIFVLPSLGNTGLSTKYQIFNIYWLHIYIYI